MGTVAEPARVNVVGRDRECAVLDGLLDAARRAEAAASDPVVVLTGEPGIGKTTLLHRLAARADGFSTLWVRASAADAKLLLTAAADLLLPLRDHFAALPGHGRKALETGLGLRAGPAPDLLALCGAAATVLDAASTQRPLLVLVDDLQWIDPTSRQVLLFLAGRLSERRIGMVVATREPYGLPDLPTVALDGLNRDGCRALAAGLGLPVPDDVLEELAFRTAGNPLAFREALAAVRSGGLSDPGDIETAWIGPAARQAWSSILDGLAPATVTAVLAVARSRSDSPRDLEPVLAGLGSDLDDLAPAERRGLATVTPDRIGLRHALLQAVVIDLAPGAERIRVDRALAANARGHLRTWYHAAATAAPDDAVAALLTAAAEDARSRGDHRAAAAAGGRAAHFCSDGPGRARHLLAAAQDAMRAGECRAAIGWAEKALQCSSDPVLTADIELVRGRAHVLTGSMHRAVDDLVGAARAVLPIDRSRAAHLYAEASWPAAMSGRVDEMLEIVGRCLDLHADAALPLRTGAVAATALVVGGRLAEARTMLTDATAALDANSPDLPDLQHATFVGQAHLWLEDHTTARRVVRHVIDAARRDGSPTLLAPALLATAEVAWWTGGWTEGREAAAEGLRRAEGLGQAPLIVLALVTLGRFDAARGDSAACRAGINRVLRATGNDDLGSINTYFRAVLGLDALSSGALDDAVEHLERARQSAEDHALACPTVVPFCGDLVEAYLRRHDRSGASTALRRVERIAEFTGLAYPRAVAARCRGVLATDLAAAREHFAQAHAVHDGRNSPFERARTLLCEGESLRRLRQPGAARAPLRDALVIFDRLGARPWSDRAVAELVAAGGRTDRAPTGLDVLTPQELQIARTVARGVSNVEVAAALFLSRKTVEAHLSRIYRKLGLRSRSELARVFGERAGLDGRAPEGTGNW